MKITPAKLTKLLKSLSLETEADYTDHYDQIVEVITGTHQETSKVAEKAVYSKESAIALANTHTGSTLTLAKSQAHQELVDLRDEVLDSAEKYSDKAVEIVSSFSGLVAIKTAEKLQNISNSKIVDLSSMGDDDDFLADLDMFA